MRHALSWRVSSLNSAASLAAPFVVVCSAPALALVLHCGCVMFLSFILSSLRRWRYSRETARQVSGLTDRELSDTGISSRSDIAPRSPDGIDSGSRAGPTCPFSSLATEFVPAWVRSGNSLTVARASSGVDQVQPARARSDCRSGCIRKRILLQA